MKLNPNYLTIVKDGLVAFVVLGLLMLAFVQLAPSDNTQLISTYKHQMQILEDLKQEYRTRHVLDPNREYLLAEINQLEASTLELETRFDEEGVSYE